MPSNKKAMKYEESSSSSSNERDDGKDDDDDEEEDKKSHDLSEESEKVSRKIGKVTENIGKGGLEKNGSSISIAEESPKSKRPSQSAASPPNQMETGGKEVSRLLKELKIRVSW